MTLVCTNIDTGSTGLSLRLMRLPFTKVIGHYTNTQRSDNRKAPPDDVLRGGKKRFQSLSRSPNQIHRAQECKSAKRDLSATQEALPIHKASLRASPVFCSPRAFDLGYFCHFRRAVAFSPQPCPLGCFPFESPGV